MSFKGSGIYQQSGLGMKASFYLEGKKKAEEEEKKAEMLENDLKAGSQLRSQGNRALLWLYCRLDE